MIEYAQLAGPSHGLEPAAHPELPVETSQVGLDRLRRDEERRGDLLVPQALRQQLENVLLPIRQRCSECPRPMGPRLTSNGGGSFDLGSALERGADPDHLFGPGRLPGQSIEQGGHRLSQIGEGANEAPRRGKLERLHDHGERRFLVAAGQIGERTKRQGFDANRYVMRRVGRIEQPIEQAEALGSELPSASQARTRAR